MPDRACQFGLPSTIRVAQGGQFTSKELDLWAYANDVTLDFSRPGKPTDLECLGQHWFMDPGDARNKVADWRVEYNEMRPHSAIDDRTPASSIRQPRHNVETQAVPKNLT